MAEMAPDDGDIAALRAKLEAERASLCTDAFRWAEAKVNKGIALGAEVAKARSHLTEADGARQLGSIASAIALARKAEEAAELAIDQLRYIHDRTRRVQEKLKSAADLGWDMTIADRFFDQATHASSFDTANYFFDAAEQEADGTVAHFREIRELIDAYQLGLTAAQVSGLDVAPAIKAFEKSKRATQYESARHYLKEAIRVLPEVTTPPPQG